MLFVDFIPLLIGLYGRIQPYLERKRCLVPTPYTRFLRQTRSRDHPCTVGLMQASSKVKVRHPGGKMRKRRNTDSERTVVTLRGSFELMCPTDITYGGG